MIGPVVGGLFRYVGGAHRWAKGLTVTVVAVHRGDQVLGAEDDVGEVQPDDMLEFAPFHAGSRAVLVRDQRYVAVGPIGDRWGITVIAESVLRTPGSCTSRGTDAA